MQTTLKTIAEGRVGGYLVVWGSHDSRDLQGEYFTPETELGLEWYDRRPVLYHHGLDGDLKSSHHRHHRHATQLMRSVCGPRHSLICASVMCALCSAW